MTPTGENWADIEQLVDDGLDRRRRQRHDDGDSFFDALAGRTEGGLAIRDGAPDGPIIVLDPDEAASYCGCKPGTCAISSQFDGDPDPLLPADSI